MRTGLKVLLIFVVFVIGGMIIAVSKSLTGHSSNSVGGPIGLILAVALLAAARAIWKYNPESKSSGGTELQKKNEDNTTLDKS